MKHLPCSGVGSFDLIDNDTVALTNLNRQIIATLDTVGQPKVEVMAKRIASINPDAKVNCANASFYRKISTNLISRNMITLSMP